MIYSEFVSKIDPLILCWQSVEKFCRKMECLTLPEKLLCLCQHVLSLILMLLYPQVTTDRADKTPTMPPHHAHRRQKSLTASLREPLPSCSLTTKVRTVYESIEHFVDYQKKNLAFSIIIILIHFSQTFYV